MGVSPSTLVGLAAIALAFASAPRPASAQNAYYPAAVDPKRAPEWERPKLTHFSAMRCSAGSGVVIDQLTLNRDDDDEATGVASYVDATRQAGYEHGAGGWTLQGETLRVEGDGFVLEGRWVGAMLTAVITRNATHVQQRCRYQVANLRSFHQYQ